MLDGQVSSVGGMMVRFCFTQLNYSSLIMNNFAVIPNAKDVMAISRDLLNALGIVVNFRDVTIEWDGNTARPNTGNTMQDVQEVVDELPDEIKLIDQQQLQPEELLSDAEVDSWMRKQFLDLLTEHRDLYNGHLGRMKLPDYRLPISPDYELVHAMPYSIPNRQRVKRSND